MIKGFDFRQARMLAGVDPRTDEEKFIDEVHHYIKMEAERGNRKMIFRIPEKYSNRYLVWDVKDYLIHEGYDVLCNYPDYEEMVVQW